MKRTLLSFFLLATFSLSGCIMHKVQQSEGLVGDLFREDFNTMLPKSLHKAIIKERALYEQIQKVNLVLARQDCHTDPDEIKALEVERWELIDAHFAHEQELDAIKGVLCFGDKMEETELRTHEKELEANSLSWAKSARTFLEKTKKYKGSLLSKFLGA